jgi:hypothetical protein
MAKKRKQYDDDDGRVIADMNVDGMPWYTPKKDAAPEGGESPQLSGHDTWAMIWGVLKAALMLPSSTFFCRRDSPDHLLSVLLAASFDRGVDP